VNLRDAHQHIRIDRLLECKFPKEIQKEMGNTHIPFDQEIFLSVFAENTDLTKIDRITKDARFLSAKLPKTVFMQILLTFIRYLVSLPVEIESKQEARKQSEIAKELRRSTKAKKAEFDNAISLLQILNPDPLKFDASYLSELAHERAEQSLKAVLSEYCGNRGNRKKNAQARLIYDIFSILHSNKTPLSDYRISKRLASSIGKLTGKPCTRENVINILNRTHL